MDSASLVRLLIVAYLIPFLIASYFAGRRQPGGYGPALLAAVPEFLAYWLPLVGSVLLLYLLAAIGLVGVDDLVRARITDRAELLPRLIVAVLYGLGLAELFHLSRSLLVIVATGRGLPTFGQSKALAMLVVALAALYLLWSSPYMLLLVLPMVSWIFIDGRQKRGRILDLLLFLVGWTGILALLVFIGFFVAHIGIWVLWDMLVRFAIGSFRFQSALASAAVISAGLMLVVRIEMPASATDGVASEQAS